MIEMNAPLLAIQFPLDSLVGFLGAALLAFVLITLVASYLRFQDVLRLSEEPAEEDALTPLSLLQIKLAHFLTESGREKYAFCVVKGYLGGRGASVDARLRELLRADDYAVELEEGLYGLVIRCDREDVEPILIRLRDQLLREAGVVSAGLRLGVAMFPEDGATGRALLASADSALSGLEGEGFFGWYEPELDEEEGEGEEDSRLDDADDADEEEEDEGAGGGRLLDPLTGVLRDKVLSTYMHRRLNEFRLKKHPVALFCVGVDNMDQIQRFHGEAAHDALLAEVSQQLQLNLRSGDMIGRHEERGFLVLVGCGVEYMEAVAQRVCGAVQQAICRFEGKRLRTTVTVGISHYPAHGKNLHQLYVKGDKVVSYCWENDIRGYAVYAEQLHGRQKVLPAASIKATRR